MKIAILSSNFIRVPPEPEFVPKGSSGAPEKVMYTIAEKMVSKGHNVFLFASGDSRTAARLISVTDKATSLDLSINDKARVDYEHLLISKCYSMAKQEFFELIHSIYDIRSAFYTQFVSTPTISTLHSPLSGHKKTIL